MVEQAGRRIDLVTIDGTHQRTIIMDMLAEPTDVALDPINGLVHYMSRDAKVRLYSPANLSFGVTPTIP